MFRAMLRVNYFLHFKNNQDLKMLGFFVKLYSRVLILIASSDPRVNYNINNNIKLGLTLNIKVSGL